MIETRPCIKRIQPYVPGKSAEEVAAEYGVTDIIKLGSNENPLGPPALAVAALQAEATNAALYPDGASADLVAKLAARLGMQRDMFIVGNGSDEVIKLLAEAYLEPTDEVVYAEPTFSEYAYATRLMGAQEVAVPLKNGVHDLDAMLAAVTPRTKLVFICNPNNPTGTTVNETALKKFLAALPRNVLVVCDEAYAEYAEADDFPDTMSLIRNGENVVTLRTFSKIYGLAGLRVGYGIAPPEIMANIRRVKEPFNVNRLAQCAALAALDDNDHLDRSIEMNKKERQRLTLRLSELGFEPTPSQANFVWVNLKRPAQPVFQALLRQGIIVRAGNSFGKPNHIRITVGTAEQNDVVIQALQQLIAVQ